MTIATIMRLYGDRGQIIDGEYASDKAQILAMSLYIKDLEKKLSLEAEGCEPEREGEAGNAGEAVILSWKDFFGVVREMRKAQKRYFRTREKEDLIRSRYLEKAVDQAITGHEAKEE